MFYNVFSTAVLVVTYIIWSEIDEVQSHDDLKFWERDPKFELEYTNPRRNLKHISMFDRKYKRILERKHKKDLNDKADDVNENVRNGSLTTNISLSNVPSKEETKDEKNRHDNRNLRNISRSKNSNSYFKLSNNIAQSFQNRHFFNKKESIYRALHESRNHGKKQRENRNDDESDKTELSNNEQLHRNRPKHHGHYNGTESVIKESSEVIMKTDRPVKEPVGRQTSRIYSSENNSDKKRKMHLKSKQKYTYQNEIKENSFGRQRNKRSSNKKAKNQYSNARISNAAHSTETLSSEKHYREHNSHLRGRPKLRYPCTYKDKVKEGTARFTMMPAMLMQKIDSDSNEDLTPAQKNESLFTNLSPYSTSKQLKKLKRKFVNANITQEIIGRTLSYNDIVLIKITEKQRSFFRTADESKYMDETPEKKIIFIVHGLSVLGFKSLTCMHEEVKFTQLLSYYLAHLDKFDIFLIPIANPDGVSEHRNSKSEMWNKNLSPQDACVGVALDRNFDVDWVGPGGKSSCSQQYPGTTPFSEPESRAIRSVLNRYSHKIAAYINVHASSYSAAIYKGDAVLYPKGYTEVQNDDDKYIDLRAEIDEAMRNASFKVFSVAVEPLHSWYGKVHGTSVDYATTVYGIPYGIEMAMQLYYDEILIEDSEEKESNVALSEVWRRVIDVVFNNIYRNLHDVEPN